MYFFFHPISSLNHFVARVFTDKFTLIVTIVFFIFLSLTYKNPFWQKLDEIMYKKVDSSENTSFKNHASDFAIFGNAIFHIVFSLILCLIFLLIKHKPQTVISILFVLIFSWGFNRLLKLIYKRERPYDPNIPPRSSRRRSYCFPSGHVMASIPIYFFSAVLLQNLITFLPWYIIALTVTFLVIISRIYLNHHYLTDVLGGVAMGIFCLNISIWFYFFVGLI